MARIKLVYLGGGSTRAAGTMASFLHNGADFDGSEVVLVDLDAERLELVRTLSDKMARSRGLDITVSATTDRAAALDGCDAVLSSFRPGGFAARVHDERIPLEHGTIGQETQGAGGFFMALRAIHVLDGERRRQLELAARMGSIPADYFMYYYFRDEILAEARAKKTTRAEDIMSWAPGYWQHYEEQARLDDPQLDPARSRGGIHELELAIDVMDAIFNDKDEIHPVNMPNRGGALQGFPDDLVVEVEGRCHGGGIDVLPASPLPRHVRGLVEMLGEYQALAAEAAWNGTRKDAVRALYANPLVLNVELAERLYDALAAAHRPYLPERLLAA